jgi:hypothetical protein
VTIEEFHAKLGVIANLSTLEMRTSATAKMLAKGAEYLLVDVAQDAAFPYNKAAEMGGGSNVSNRASWRVSIAFELICERIDVWSTDSNAKALQRLGRGEKLL